MYKLPRNVVDRIGSTSLVALRKIAPPNGARILMKLESENPTGSVKDRMALAMIEAAEADGRLKPGGSVDEYTGGSTGVSLWLVCSVKGSPLHIVTSDAFSQEKLDHMTILGAKLQIVPSDSGRMTEKLTRDLIEAARVITEKTGAYWTDQLNNQYQTSSIKLTRFLQKRLWLWRFGWLGKKASSRVLPLAQMSSPLCDWLNNWDLPRQLSASCVIQV